MRGTSMHIMKYLFYIVVVSWVFTNEISAEGADITPEQAAPITVEGERIDLGGRGRILDDVVVVKEDDSYSIEIRFSQFLRSIWYTPHGVGKTVTIKLEPSLTSRVDRDALSDRAVIVPDIEGPFPVEEILYEGVFRSSFDQRRTEQGFLREVDEGPFLVLRFNKEYKIDVIQDSGFRSLTIRLEKN